MKRSWAMKWARDLETTGAKQAKDVLNNGKGGFCCLGRLCIVAGLRAERWKDGTMVYDGKAECLPMGLQEIVGMKTSNGEFASDKTLAALNDAGTSFPEIAKVIRKHWKRL